jgi:hypothetical protein
VLERVDSVIKVSLKGKHRIIVRARVFITRKYPDIFIHLAMKFIRLIIHGRAKQAYFTGVILPSVTIHHFSRALLSSTHLVKFICMNIQLTLSHTLFSLALSYKIDPMESCMHLFYMRKARKKQLYG